MGQIVVGANSGASILIANPSGPPSRGWRDIEGLVNAQSVSGSNPTYAAMSAGGAVRAWFYSATDILGNVYHIPHDYAPNTDIFWHLHWGHNGTNISGNIVLQVSMRYAAPYNAAPYTTEKTFALTIPATNLTVAPANSNIISEIQITAQTAAPPTANQYDSSLFEVDGKFNVYFSVTSLPTITGGTQNNQFFVLGADLHIQSTNLGTLNRNAPFYS
jgi:hypothetical protein